MPLESQPEAQPGFFSQSFVVFKIRLSAPKLQNKMGDERASMRSAGILEVCAI